mgnify:CR=1 FL=1
MVGIKGHERPEKLKVTVCVDGGYMAEAEMSYAGLNALKRAKLAGEVVLTCRQDFSLNAFTRA